MTLLNLNRNKVRERMFGIFFLLVFMYLFSFANNPYFGVVGKVGILFMVCFVGLSLLEIAKLLKRHEIVLIVFFALMIFIRVIHLINNDVSYVLSSVMQYAMCLGILLIFSHLEITKRTIKIFHIFFFGFNILGVIDYFMSADKIAFKIFGSMNTFSAVFLFLFLIGIFFKFHDFRPIYWFNLIAAFILVVSTDSRTSLLTLILIFLIYLILKVFKGNKTNQVIFPVFLISMVILIYLYINITEMPIYDTINKLSLKLFNKNIDSGRPEIWRAAILAVQDHIWFGEGYIMSQTDYSAHNQFIQILGDSGIVGLVLFLSALCVIWFRYSRFHQDKFIRFCQACLIGFVIYNCFEVSLIQNKFALGVMQWFLLAAGLFRVQYLEERQKNETKR